MGWGYGTDPWGREIGYLVPATCDHPGCEKEIDRGVSYACGGMHGDLGGTACEGYFCDAHRHVVGTHEGTHARTELGGAAGCCIQCTSLLAHMGVIEEAEEYVTDPRFAPDVETRKILETEGLTPGEVGDRTDY